MPAWLAAAIRLLAGTPLRAGVTGATTGLAVSDLGAVSPAALSGLGIGLPGFLGGGQPRRRRRRRALTASDRADIAFVAGILGPKAGKDFALIIAAR